MSTSVGYRKGKITCSSSDASEPSISGDTPATSDGSQCTRDCATLASKPVVSSTVRPQVTSQRPQIGRLQRTEDRKCFERMLQDVFKEWDARKQAVVRQRHKIDSDRRKFMAAFNDQYTTNTDPNFLKSVPAMRTQLQAEFIHVHYARDGQDFFPSKIILLDTPDTASFVAATNALYLTQLATSNNDRALMNNALRTYQGALYLLRRDLSKPKACEDDRLFATIHIMSLCEAFKGISLDGSGAKQHKKGVALLFRHRGSTSVRSIYTKVQLQHYQRQALVEGLVCRKRQPAASGSWLGVSKSCHIRLTDLTSVALHVPGALEDSDRLCAVGSLAPVDEIMDMLSRLQTLERELQNWMTSWYRDFSVQPYTKVSIEAFSWLGKRNRPEEAPFPHALDFPNPVFAKAHVIFWMPLLALRQAIKTVAELNPFPLLAQTSTAQARRLNEGSRECADNLCMTAMFFCRPSNGIDGLMEACDALQLAAKFYEKGGNADKLAWCYQMFRNIEARGVRAPTIAQHESVQLHPP
ncbi:hypothetical protein LTR37_007560 [Vermiconidia calcicola]|uniref:Uncharacterized protein n=1 Tax=Vermiconidia calcicola TaxID=1690605 RepID=A0ACC3NEQ2_9PEZI|nr:hypothetical protein LTR37_007560 [Vermiconidia calcicola]